MLNKVATEADRFLEDIGSGAEQRAPWQDAMARQEFATMVAAAWEQDQSTALTRNYSMRSTWQHTGAIRRYAGSIWDKIDTPGGPRTNHGGANQRAAGLLPRQQPAG